MATNNENINRPFNTPILMVIFNRPELTIKLFEEIKKIKPKFLYVSADGPRKNNKMDDVLCRETRKIIKKGVDWDCNLNILFHNENQGCGIAINKAISWFFKNATEGIILEDDCIPHPDFFNFCSTLLERYRLEEKIFMISGDSVSGNYIPPQNKDYTFTYTPGTWGWATWRRSIEKYDFHLNSLEQFRTDKIIEKIYSKREYQNYWLNFFQEIKDRNINNWDYQMAFTSFKHQGLCVRPRSNLITNLGTTIAANGNKEFTSEIKGLKLSNHPEKIEVDVLADNTIMRNLTSLNYKIKLFLKKIKLFYFFKKIYKSL